VISRDRLTATTVSHCQRREAPHKLHKLRCCLQDHNRIGNPLPPAFWVAALQEHALRLICPCRGHQNATDTGIYRRDQNRQLPIVLAYDCGKRE